MARRVVVAFDAFKESLNAHDAAAAFGRGWRKAAADDVLVACPLSDGGEGFVDALASARRPAVTVTGPYGAPVDVEVGRRDQLSVVALAQTSGLEVCTRRDPCVASTFGFGEVLAGLHGDVLVGLGGSATVDGGLGMMRAWGGVFVDDDGKHIEHAGDLVRLAHAQLPTLPCPITVAVDVQQPLPGCARVFGPQKGASDDDVERLEAGLARLADVIDPDGLHRRQPGSGAAGGVGFALSVLGAQLRPGVDVVLDAVDFDGRLSDADLVVTGEGRLDAQSALGKVVAGVARRCRHAQTPCVAVVGALLDGWETLLDDGLTAAFSLAPGPRSLQDALTSTAGDLERQGEQLARLLR